MSALRFQSIGVRGVSLGCAVLWAVACGTVEPTSTAGTGSGGATTSSASSSKASGTGAGGGGAFTGACATLASCCANIADPAQKSACLTALQASGDLSQVCSDALVKFGPECGGAQASASVGTGVGGGSMCGSPGATPAPLPAECQPVAGACLYHEHDTPMAGAQIVCMEYSGQWSAIVSSAATQCTSGGPPGMHEWVVGKTCGQAEAGIQAGCEFHPNGTTLCNVTYYGQGCMTALGASCNQNTMLNGVWVAP